MAAFVSRSLHVTHLTFMRCLKTGSWVTIFWVLIVCDVAAALMALFWLRPLAKRTINRSEIMRQADAVTLCELRDAA